MSASEFALGLDVGGSRTRWSLAAAPGVVARGSAGPFGGQQLQREEDRREVQAVLEAIARDVGVHGAVRSVCAGVTGLAIEQRDLIARLLAEAFGVKPEAVQVMTDIELACRAAFAPGEGYLVYAGTGSVAAFVDDAGVLHRAGGRGGLIDDGGSGYWIAREALRRVWRAEDEAPGAWRVSPLARALFARLGGDEWAHTRRFVHAASRGEMGELALAVAVAAADDESARSILREAGVELARLALALTRRHGARPVALAGRVFELHPAIEASLRAALPAHAAVQPIHLQPDTSAATLAWQHCR